LRKRVIQFCPCGRGVIPVRLNSRCTAISWTMSSGGGKPISSWLKHHLTIALSSEHVSRCWTLWASARLLVAPANRRYSVLLVTSKATLAAGTLGSSPHSMAKIGLRSRSWYSELSFFGGAITLLMLSIASTNKVRGYQPRKRHIAARSGLCHF